MMARTLQRLPIPRSGWHADSSDGISVAAARRLAEQSHAAHVDARGEPYISHLGRVAAAAPLFARPVAWLQDAVGRTNVDESALIHAGASAAQRRALRLLRRDEAERSDDAYMAHVRAIALSEGRAGEIARVVKRADLIDHTWCSPVRHDGWTPPYRAALVVLALMNNKRRVPACRQEDPQSRPPGSHEK